MKELSDQELLYLSNLMHMRKEEIRDKSGNIVESPFKDVWNEKNLNRSISSIINSIDTDALRNNKALSEHTFDGEISGKEWADMIDAMKTSDICNLRLKKVKIDDKRAISTYFTDENGNGYVAFRGTSAGEWKDNFEGGFVTDTEQQKRALDFINSINNDDLTVVGHSKGGNKAKYVSIMSDKVSRCLSFDGQGFSDNFIEKYKDLIQANKGKITCYALDNDFVNILLYDIYNTKMYVKGNGVANFAQNHSPNSFFNFQYDKDGKVIGYQFIDAEQGEALQTLHKFVNYVAYNTNPEEREKLFGFLGDLAEMALGKKPPDYTEKYSTKDMLAFITKKENLKQLKILLDYMKEYEKHGNKISDAVIDIVVEWDLLADYIKFRKKQSELRSIFWNLGGYFMSGDWQKLDGTDDYNMEQNEIKRDYSQETRDMLLDLTDEVKSEKFYDITKWDIRYRVESWFGHLTIDNYKNNIEGYYRKEIDINGTSHQQMQQIFNDVDEAQTSYEGKLRGHINEMRHLSKQINDVLSS